MDDEKLVFDAELDGSADEATESILSSLINFPEEPEGEEPGVAEDIERASVGSQRSRRRKPVNYLHEAARQYHELGLPITLCRGKAPISKDWPNHVWTMDSMDAAYQLHAATNVGVVLGPRSGLVDFDGDGEAAEATFFELFDGEVIDTPTWRSKRGLHRLFKWHPALEQVGKSKIVLGEGDATLEILIGPGVQTLLPPSWSDGVQRKWVEGEKLFPHGAASIPDSVLKKLGCCLDSYAVASRECSAVRCTDTTDITDTTDNTDTTDTVTLSVVSVISVLRTSPSTATQILATIQRCTVRSSGTTNTNFLSLATSLKGLPGLADKMGEDFEPLIRAWYTASLPHMREKDWQDAWERWLYLWLWAKPGHNIVVSAYTESLRDPFPECALDYPSQVMRRLVGLCRTMSQRYADSRGVWFLGCRSAAEVLGVKYTTAAKLLKMLVKDGVLELAEPGTTRKASRYRYLGD